MPPVTVSSSRQDDPGPADLLWRHRFQQQHMQLLERMKALEKRDATYDQRTAQAEQSAATCNATTAAFELLCKRFEAIEEDDEQQRQNELVSKILGEQTREVAVLKDKIKGIGGLHSKFRESEDHVNELRQTLSQYSNIMKSLEAKIDALEKKRNEDTRLHADVARSSIARIKLLETREGTKENQLRDMMVRLAALETEYKTKQAEMQRSIEGMARQQNARSMAVQDRAEVCVPQSPEAGKSPPETVRPTAALAHQRIPFPQKSSRVAIIPGLPQQNAQVLPMVGETQGNTQATTQMDEPEWFATSATLGGDEATQPPRINSPGPAPKKKAKHNNTKPPARDGPKGLQRNPQKIVVLRCVPSSDPITAAPQDKPQNERSAKEPKQRQVAPARPSPPKVRQGGTIPEPATQSQTTHFLRRSARRRGNDASDTQHVELGRAGDLCVLPNNQRKVSGSSKADPRQPKGVSMDAKATSPPPAANGRQAKKAAGTKVATASSKPAASTLRPPAPVLKKRKRPKLDDLEWM